VVQPGEAASASSPLLDAAALKGGSAPELVLVLLGSQLRTSDLRRQHAASLKALLEGASSSVALPYVVHEEGSIPTTKQLREAIQARLAGSSDKLQTAGCGEGLSVEAAAQLLLEGTGGGGPRVLLGCLSAPSVADELQQVASAHGAVAALGKRLVTFYAVAPGDEGGSGGGGAATAEQRRRLMAVAGDKGYTTCDARCRVRFQGD